MGFFDRFSRLLRANLNELLTKAEDPVKILDQSLVDMEDDLIRLRKAVAMSIACQKRLVSKYDQAQLHVKNWYQRAEMAIKQGEETLAREALIRRKTYKESSEALNTQILSQGDQVEKLKHNLGILEGKIADLKTKKEMLKARAQAAKAQQQLQDAVGHMGSNSAMAAFDRMQDKVESLEASSQASAELAGADLESKFSLLEEKDDINEELSQLRKSLKESVESVALPSSELVDSDLNNSYLNEDIEVVKVSEVENDLEELKRKFKKL